MNTGAASERPDIDARLLEIERELQALALQQAELHSGFANSLRAEDWERPIEVDASAEYRAALLAERERLLRARGRG